MTVHIQKHARPGTLYERLGDDVFHRLSLAFYARAATDPIVGPMLPKNLTAAAERQSLFLIQFFGGPTTYSNQSGHPRLRARHLPFRVDKAARDAWMATMQGALDDVGIDGGERAELLEYFERASTFLINS